jgi:hypothetical protein
MKKRKLSLDKEVLSIGSAVDGAVAKWVIDTIIQTISVIVSVSLGELSVGGECNSTADCITNDPSCGQTCQASCAETCAASCYDGCDPGTFYGGYCG